MDDNITLPETREECEQAVPMALTGLMLSYQQMQQITDYCKQTHNPYGQDEQVREQVHDYAATALQNCAFHVHNLSAQMTQFLGLQAQELESLEMSLKSAQDRIRLAQEVAGVQNVETAEKTYSVRERMCKLTEEEAPESAPLPRGQRDRLDLGELDDIGISLGDE
mmetsp:Transcript_20076/g.31459  ORF Transcript_20076/g.31459 Transcript_20076/m.31459 type:complete len:166 (-) Transcript_20076:29-526(-)|eukprot:CAMPEP_0201521080 /NCGR_PEP_ID=MMETSP0161_2-20130828/14058_1 /ASSEMBLY_ACC=CAM_ASM_000251 /TAXON_ID=180227 /ORGANISM="Neoparamoeba aestuarina, Strain SoJaBio B1-5/56/2" /LENGTH=165 /DNA_ID=CAMNT_0047919647 /DNA_START=72 /DNA_END=569 /DNA_ORIENTATION=-